MLKYVVSLIDTLQIKWPERIETYSKIETLRIEYITLTIVNLI